MDMAWAAEAAAGRGGGAGGHWQLILIVGAIGFLGLFARWRKARAKAGSSSRELRARDEDPNRYRDVADRAIVELLETSRILNAQVDGKIRSLNRLVKEAEENGARLEKLLAEAKAMRAIDPGPAPSAESKHAETPREPEGPHFLSELHERIYRLRGDGKTPAEIARATNLSITEVEFIVKSF